MLQPGDRLEQWEVIAPLGEGGMGSVYRCRHVLSAEIEAAVKTLKPDYNDPEGRQRFLREVRSLIALRHPAIVRVMGFGEDPQRNLLWMAMELVPGQDLSKRLHTGPLPPEAARALFITLADGLAHAHSRRIFHRDIKPANIIVRAPGEGMLVDFGIAILEGSTRLTATGFVTGTAAYIAPEIFRGDLRPSSEAADVYALGQCLYEALRGQDAFPEEPGLSKQQRLVRLINIKIQTAVLDPGPGVPEPLRAIVRAATRAHPHQRLASAAEFAERLRNNAVSVEPVPQPTLSPLSWTDDPPTTTPQDPPPQPRTAEPKPVTQKPVAQKSVAQKSVAQKSVAQESVTQESVAQEVVEEPAKREALAEASRGGGRRAQSGRGWVVGVGLGGAAFVAMFVGMFGIALLVTIVLVSSMSTPQVPAALLGTCRVSGESLIARSCQGCNNALLPGAQLDLLHSAVLVFQETEPTAVDIRAAGLPPTQLAEVQRLRQAARSGTTNNIDATWLESARVVYEAVQGGMSIELMPDAYAMDGFGQQVWTNFTVLSADANSVRVQTYGPDGYTPWSQISFRMEGAQAIVMEDALYPGVQLRCLR